MTIVLTPQEAMALYLYGSKSVPTNKLDPNLIELSSEPKTSVDVNQYMDSGPGRFVTAKDFDYVYKFFNPVTTPVNPRQQLYVDLAPGTYSDVEVAAHFGSRENITRYQTALSDGIDDQAESAFVWQSVAFEIQDDTTR
jgi:hypothetical protein